MAAAARDAAIAGRGLVAVGIVVESAHAASVMSVAERIADRAITPRVMRIVANKWHLLRAEAEPTP
jgi:hypothetical protein